MDNKLENQVLIMKASNYKLDSDFNEIKSDRKKIYSDTTKMRSDVNKIKTMLTQMTNHKHHSSPYNMDSPKAQYPQRTQRKHWSGPQ